MSKIKIGQPIRFAVPSSGQDSYQGEVFLVGKSFDAENKTVKVHGHIEGAHNNFIRGLYVEAKIYTGNQQVQALPEEAVVADEGESYIFVRVKEEHAHTEQVKPAAVGHQQAEEEAHGHEEHAEAEENHGTTFRRVQVVTGEKNQGFIEIKEVSNLPQGAEIVTQGAYYLFSEMKKGEGGHHH
jgi:cobalt-zinc-cadmium efflux system membrane fusion protein